MEAVERGLTFECEGEVLVGVVSVPSTPFSVGVLIVVGGPQYRVGSHRQFALLARALAKAGFAAMRFDYRGMGDSSGPSRSFEEVDADIEAAIAAFLHECPDVRHIVIWGLCDAASAALMYVAKNADSRVAGLVLLNPWVRSEATIAQTRIKHYYFRRLFAPDLWYKVLRIPLGLPAMVRGFARDARDALAGRGEAGLADGSFRDVMERGMDGFRQPVLLVLSGRDLTAQEFEEYAAARGRWREMLRRATVERCPFGDADHTFSSASLRVDVEQATIDWLRRRIPGTSLEQ